jgi:hypothetical protein
MELDCANIPDPTAPTYEAHATLLGLQCRRADAGAVRKPVAMCLFATNPHETTTKPSDCTQKPDMDGDRESGVLIAIGTKSRVRSEKGRGRKKVEGRRGRGGVCCNLYCFSLILFFFHLLRK